MARRKTRRKKRVPVAIVLSVVAHACLVLTLIYFTRQYHSPVRGVITIDLIETARHDSAAPSFRPRAVRLKADDPVEPRPEQPIQSSPVGDPTVAAAATDTYVQEVIRIVNQKKKYPPESLHREETGTVKIGLTIGRNGQIIDVKIEEPSPFDRLNKAALDTYVRISTFPPMPDLVQAPIHLHIPMEFSLERQ